MAPFDTSVGRMAVLRDPQGGTFSIIQPAPPEQQQ
jgi:predicted enzyme related to lactoylglutathione lyase